jgi:magnesium-transporting ATPase (P-type)
MHQQRVLGKSLQIVETFNSVSVVATDKTGTLTENKMIVTNILWDTDGEYKVIEYEEEELITKATMQQTIHRLSIGALNIAHHGRVRVAPVAERLSSGITNQSQFRPSSSFVNQRNNKLDVANELKIEAFRDLLLGAALCNDAEKQLVQDAQLGQDTSKMNSELHLVGDAVDVALYNLCVYQCHMEINEVRCLNPRLKILPFNSSNKFMISANRLEPHDLSSLDSERTILITLKGAPDIVIQRCSSYKTNDGQILPLSAQVKEKLFNRQETLGNGNNIVSKC